MKMKIIDVGQPTFDIRVKEEVYQATNLSCTRVRSSDFLKNQDTREIVNRIERVIEQEAPIDEWLLIKRVINSFGIQKAGVHVRKKMFEILDQMALNVEEEFDNAIYWKDRQKPRKYRSYRVFGRDDESKRDVTHVPIREMANAVYAMIKENPGLDEESLARITAAKMGYTRMGSNVTQSLNRAIKMAVETYHIDKRNGHFYAGLDGMRKASN